MHRTALESEIPGHSIARHLLHAVLHVVSPETLGQQATSEHLEPLHVFIHACPSEHGRAAVLSSAAMQSSMLCLGTVEAVSGSAIWLRMPDCPVPESLGNAN